MPLPRAVIEQAERSEAAHRALLENTAPVAAPQPAPVAPSVPSEPTPQPTPTPVAVEESTPQPAPAAPAPEADSWELKYRVLKGKYDAEVPRLAQKVRDLEAAAVAVPQTQSAPAAQPNAVIEEVVAKYGDEFADAVVKVANAQVSEVKQTLGADLEAMRAESARFSRQSFMRDLSSYVPNWEAVDVDPGFTAYLDELQTQTGRTRREFFSEADAQNNAARVASFFLDYLKGKTPARPTAQAPQTPTVEPLLSPDSGRPSEAPPGKKYWTSAEIKKFYDDARRGAYSAADFARIDNDISVAAQEGRYLG